MVAKGQVVQVVGIGRSPEVAGHGKGTELDVSPADRKPMLVTARAQKRGVVAHDDVSVVAASALPA